MKKLFSVVTVITVIVISLFYLFNYMKKTRDTSMPNIHVTYNKQDIETVSGLCNWFDKNTGENSWLPKVLDNKKEQLARE